VPGTDPPRADKAKAAAEAEAKLQGLKEEEQRQEQAAADAEAKRKAAEAEQLRVKEEEQRQAKAAADAEAKRKAAEAEQQRLAAIKDEEQRQAKAADVEAKLKAAEAEQQRLKEEVQRQAQAAADAEAKRKAAEAEQQRLKEEVQRQAQAAADAEAKRKAAEAEQQRLAVAKAEEERKANQPTPTATTKLFTTRSNASAPDSVSPFARVPARSTGECEQNCARTEQCNTFTYNKSSGICYQYAHVPDFVASSATFDSGVRDSVVLPGGLFTIRTNTEVTGTFIDVAIVISRDQCEQKCAQTAACKAFDYSKSAGRCHIFKGGEPPYHFDFAPNEGYDSGIRK
jgi:PAN domain